MASYSVMVAPGRPGADGPETEYVRDGFAILAFLVPWLWLLWHRLWIEALFAVAAALALAALGNIAGYGIAGSLLSLLVSIYVGLEGAALRVSALQRRGWVEWGVVEADSVDDAEVRFVTELDQDAPVSDQPLPVLQQRMANPPVASHGPGLLLNAGDR
ncbi:MAG TPA: DUF2628 domain-containing protein [Rhizobiaceae bacterium]|nr:DUF2628 domain-containing protein [Rhizobiaceae bacterium]